jgi:hypothetical protein
VFGINHVGAAPQIATNRRTQLIDALALHLLAMQCMSLTLDEIVTHQDRLRREIVERECLLAAFNVLHGYVASGNGPTTIELGSLVSALGNSAPLALPSAGSSAELNDAAAPVAPPRPPAPRPYIHPELEKISRYYGGDTLIVQWAIRRMTSDYTLTDIQALLKREGYPLNGPKISVVLTRLKRRGEIEEIRCSSGPKPALFGKPATLQGENANIEAEHCPAPARTENTEPTVATAAAA